MSTPLDTDLIVIERGNVAYKVTHEDYYDQIAGVADGGATNGIAFQSCHGQIAAGYTQQGQSKYSSTGNVQYARTDGTGTYTLSNATSGQYMVDQRPNFGFKAGASWYTIGTGTNITVSAHPSFCNAYYKRSLTSWSFTPAELATALGGTSATITAIRMEASSVPTGGYNIWPTYTFGYKLIANATDDANYSGTNGGSYTQVFAANPKSPAWTTGWNELTLSSSISWS